MTTPAEQYWWLAPSLAGFAALLVIWFNWGRPKVRSLRMKKPFKAYLTVAPKTSAGMLTELHVPPNREVEIGLRLFPRLHFKQFEFVLGFDGDESSRPLPIKFLNNFIKHGKRREQSPDDNPDHMVDYDDRYHIKETVERTHPNCYTYGFLVQTRGPGRYPVRLEVITECGEGIPTEKLFLIVETR